ncbi:hypothetical protein Ddc_14436 [Ditylenchus destructor]|nr:hypothetical protein Ddc_14436 [Ditylenchus destructor]
MQGPKNRGITNNSGKGDGKKKKVVMSGKFGPGTSPNLIRWAIDEGPMNCNAIDRNNVKIMGAWFPEHGAGLFLVSLDGVG